MLSTTLISRIESKWEQIVASVIDETHRDRRLASYQSLSTHELRRRAEDLVRNLGQWLSAENDGEVALRFEELGRRRHAEGFSLAEVVRKIQLLEEKLVGAARDENDARNALDIYGELEILRALNRFFWLANYHVVFGYESAVEQSRAAGRQASLAATTGGVPPTSGPSLAHASPAGPF